MNLANSLTVIAAGAATALPMVLPAAAAPTRTSTAVAKSAAAEKVASRCPLCGMALAANTATQDNLVSLHSDGRTVVYKCVYCALADAATDYRGLVTIVAPSQKKGLHITLKRVNGVWSAPAGAAFIAVKVSHTICNRGYRAFTSSAAAQAYAVANRAILSATKPIGLQQMVALAG